MISRDGRIKVTQLIMVAAVLNLAKKPAPRLYRYSPQMAPRNPHHRLRDRSVECELKFRVAGSHAHDRLRAILRKRGARLEGKYDEQNYRFEGPGKSTRRTTLRLRVLNGGPRGVLTAKGPANFVGGVKVREETEVEVKDAHATLDLLTELGFRVAFTYNKHRAMWMLDGAVTVTLDTLEYGWFVELEGPLEVLPGQARSLGLNPAKALKDSYSVLARKHLAKLNRAAGVC
jgi:adenylate cyclase class 2